MDKEIELTRNKKLSASELRKSQSKYIFLAIVIVIILAIIGIGVFFAVTNYFI